MFLNIHTMKYNREISKPVLKGEDKQGTCIGRCQTKLCGTGMGDKYINGTG